MVYARFSKPLPTSPVLVLHNNHSSEIKHSETLSLGFSKNMNKLMEKPFTAEAR